MKIHFLTSGSDKSRKAHKLFTEMYGQAVLDDADVIVALSGDGMVLRAFHENFNKNNIPIYGMNRGRIGFLTNKFQTDGLLERLEHAHPLKINPLVVEAVDIDGERFKSIAINEVYLMRASNQAAKLHLSVDNIPRINELICDGIIVASPIGSTAYNYSADGPVLPINCGLLSLASLSAFRPRRWKGALIENSSVVDLSIIEPYKRPVTVVADYTEFQKVASAHVYQDVHRSVTLLLDDVDMLHEKMMREQFFS